MRERVHVNRTMKDLVADLRKNTKCDRIMIFFVSLHILIELTHFKNIRHIEEEAVCLSC